MLPVAVIVSINPASPNAYIPQPHRRMIYLLEPAPNELTLEITLPIINTSGHRAHILALFCAFIVFSLAAAPLFAQSTPPGVLRVQVNLQSLAVHVTDKQGNDVKNLSSDAFTILEDGRPPKISFFGAENVPTSLNVLVDISSSMDPTGKVGSAEAIATRFLRAAHSGGEISAMEFSDQLGPFHLLTQQELRNPTPAILPSGTGQGSALFDAIASVLCHLNSSKDLRQAVVVISDGIDQHSRLDLDQLIALVQSSKAQLFMIGTRSRSEYNLNGHASATITLVSGRDIDNPAVVFDRLSRESGAESFWPISEEGLDQALKKISDLLDAQYTIAYYPESSAKGFRRIQVKLRAPGLIVNVRRGVGSQTAGAFSPDFTEGTCEISPKVHPYSYESKVIHDGEVASYREDFSDIRSGWPNRESSRYISSGYELSNSGSSKIEGSASSFGGARYFPPERDVIAAHGPWWIDFRESAVIEKVPAIPKGSPDSPAADQSAAGLVFRMNDSGYYALLLTESPKAKKLWLKLEKREYGTSFSTGLIPWTAIPQPEAAPSEITASIECVGKQILISINDHQVGQARDDSYSQGEVGFILSGIGRVRFHDLIVTSR